MIFGLNNIIYIYYAIINFPAPSYANLPIFLYIDNLLYIGNLFNIGVSDPDGYIFIGTSK